MAAKIDFDPYEVLGLKLGDDIHHVKKAYKKIARTCHPDKAKPEDKEKAEEKFHKLKKAYDFLTDKELKADYDKIGAARLIRQKAQEEKKAQSSAARRRFVDELEKSEAPVVTKKAKEAVPKSFHEMTDKEKNIIRAMNKDIMNQHNAATQVKSKPHEKPAAPATASNGHHFDLDAAEDDVLAGLL